MSAAPLPTRVLTALSLPPTAEVGQRIPKKLLLEHGTPTSADKRLIETHVAELRWDASLKPQTVAIPEYTSSTQTYTELAVLTLTLRDTAPDTSKAIRLSELVHRAIPYPLLLVSAAPEARAGAVSVAHKRYSQAAEGQIVLEGDAVSVMLKHADPPQTLAFLNDLNVASSPVPHLYGLYDRWVKAVLAHAAAQITGKYALPENGAILQLQLTEYTRLERHIIALRTQAAREKQLSRRADLNLKVRALEIEKAKLTF